jgi:hypothetical protein
MKLLVVGILIAIVASLGHAWFTLASGPDNSGRMARALAVRVVPSVGLFLAPLVGWRLGLIQPYGAR